VCVCVCVHACVCVCAWSLCVGHNAHRDFWTQCLQFSHAFL